MSGGTIFSSNGNELFTNENPAKVQLATGSIQTTPSGKQDVKVVDPLPAGTNIIGKSVTASASGNEVAIQTTPVTGDSSISGAFALYTGAFNQLYNGATWDRQRNNMEGLLLASASRTVATGTPNQTNHNAKGVMLCLDVTAIPNATETLTLEIKTLLNGNGSWAYANYLIPANTIGKFYLLVYPGIVEKTINRVAQVSTIIPRTWYASVGHSGSGAWTYSLSYATIV